MKDMYGKEVLNGDLMVEGHEEYCYIFKVKNNKPVLVGRWGTGMLSKYSEDEIMKSSMKIKEGIILGEVPSFMRGYYDTMLNRIQNMPTENLMKVQGINVKIYNKFLDEKHESITYTFDFNGEEESIAYFPDEEIVGER